MMGKLNGKGDVGMDFEERMEIQASAEVKYD